MRASRTRLPFMSLLTLVLLTTLFCLPSLALARTWNVPVDAATIQAGIDSSSAGDTVLVAPGTYYENLTVKSGIHVIAEDVDPTATVVDANAVGAPVAFLNLAETSYLEGFTVTEGLTNYGGGIVCINAAPEIVNCRIIDNHANQQGGGVLCDQWAAPVFTGCVFAGNTSGETGGVLDSYNSSSTTFINCTMYENSAPYGSAVSLLYSSVILQNSIIAFGSGGEPVNCAVGGSASLSCCDIYGNAGGDWVGCIAGQAGTNGNLSTNPRFCDADTGDFHLSPCSPCLGAPGCGLVGALGSGSCALTWHVPSDFATIGDALDAVCAGDTIIVASGTYHEYDLGMKPGVVLLSETGLASSVTIDADSLGRVMRCELLDSSTVIRGFTFEDGYADSGGAILCQSASPRISNCDFYDCHATDAGGALYCNASSPGLTGCRILQNTAPRGAGGYLTSGASPHLTDCTFSEGVASLEGGGLYLSLSSSAHLDTCRFIQNSADSAGGAVCSYDCSVIADSCYFDHNTAYDGAAVWKALAAPDTFTSCDFNWNWANMYGGHGGAYFADGASAAFIDSRISANTCSDNSNIYSSNTTLTMEGCEVLGDLVLLDSPRTVLRSCYCRARRAVNSHNSNTVITGCEFDHCGSDEDDPNGGAIKFTGTSLDTLVDCTFILNQALPPWEPWGRGGAVFIDGPAVALIGCYFTENISDYGGAVFSSGPLTTFTRCTFYDNRGAGAVYMQNQAAASLDSCTFHANRDVDRHTCGGLYCSDASPEVRNTIIAFSTWGGNAVTCAGVSNPVLTCCDVYGNAGGDWVGCIAGQEGISGNFSSDPRFCDPASGDIRLRSSSPCVNKPGCGQIGAYGLSCHDEAPHLTTISDVANDQGRWMRLTWFRSTYDAPAESISILGYAVYRRQDDFLARGEEAEPRIADGSIFSGAPLMTGWDCVGYVPARGDSAYQLVSPTLCDSTDAGICWSVFMVSATTDDPTVYFDSEPDSGYSVDNLAPAPPPGLNMASPTELAWEEVPDVDFDYYSVYGSALAELDETATLIGHTIGLTKDVAGHVYDYYHVTATDFAGNEGEESSVNNSFAGVPGLPGGPDIPAAFALKQNRPNPFAMSTVITFDLPEARRVTLRVFDAQGRLVSELVSRAYEPGRHSAEWDGRDQGGSPAGTGVYFIRMEAGDFRDMKKVMLLR